jgi:histone-lysine N-methyltransferase SETD1
MCATRKFIHWACSRQTPTTLSRWSSSTPVSAFLYFVIQFCHVLPVVDFVRACGGSPGDVVRQQVADKREHEYLQRGIACYLFALDDQQIIDSSMKGNSARFINHCCDVRPRIPSGYQRVLLAGLQAFEYDVCTCQIYLCRCLRCVGGVQPNCTARVMNLDGAKRIIFSTLQEIAPGEEFTYDYKFAPDSDPAKRHTIPCNCGAAICRKWLN